MKSLPENLRLSQRNFLFVLMFLVAVSLFSPKGLFRLMIMKQEILRLEKNAEKLSNDNVRLHQEIADFRRSPLAKERAIRSELGLLRENEWSVEFPNDSNDP